MCLWLLPAMLLPVSAPATADDLNPVTMKSAPGHAPVVLVDGKAAKGCICVMGEQSANLAIAVKELQACIESATGAKLPIVSGKIRSPAIVIGNCDEARAQGLDGGKMPVEGFEIKTAADRVFIVGSDGVVDEASKTFSDGTAWGVAEFLERIVGVRWYWPADRGGRSVIPKADLVVKPVSLADAPVFRKRVYYPPAAPSRPIDGKMQKLQSLCTMLRAANSWPISLRVHQPSDWGRNDDYRRNRPEIFQLNPDGSRDFSMFCYSSPRTLQTFLENIDDHFAGRTKVRFIAGNAITVSPPDIGLNCQCEPCRKLWDPDGGGHGAASKIMVDFVTRLATEVKTRYPGKTVIYLAYSNYTRAPEGCKLPDNVQVQICGMPGIARYKEPSVLAADQANIDRWAAASGQKTQDWHYSCWPADRTQAPYQYPHVLRAYYQSNRDKTVGTFINGGYPDEWPRFHISLYCWLKLLWNPDFDVDAAIDQYCRRMYGPAADTVRRIVQLELDGWEKSRWPEGRLSPKAIYEISYPKATIQEMKQLLRQASREAAADAQAAGRLAYFADCFDDFFQEYAAVMEGAGQRILEAQKVDANPTVDGNLDDAVWAKAVPATLVGAHVYPVKRAGSQDIECKYPTAVRAVYTLDGITFGFRMTEPDPANLKRVVRTNDHALTWQDDCVEIFLDPTGKNLGRFFQFVINSGGSVQDARDGKFDWNAEGLKTAVRLGQDHWSVEVFIPFKTLGDQVRGGTGVVWFGQFSRHRTAGAEPKAGGVQENQRLNARFGGPNSNLADFAPMPFRE
jgi:hypothetical protein